MYGKCALHIYLNIYFICLIYIYSVAAHFPNWKLHFEHDACRACQGMYECKCDFVFTGMCIECVFVTHASETPFQIYIQRIRIKFPENNIGTHQIVKWNEIRQWWMEKERRGWGRAEVIPLSVCVLYVKQKWIVSELSPKYMPKPIFAYHPH